MPHLPISEILLRLCLAFVGGFVIGWERESHGRAAGLRTTILACVGSAVAMIVNEVVTYNVLADSPSAGLRSDPTRLGAGILAGFGFLGAGTIMRHENVIRGVTTAASLWFGSVMGLAFGSGQFLTGFIGTGLALLTLVGLPLFERLVKADAYANLTVNLGIDSVSEHDLRKRVEGLGPVVRSMKLRYALPEKQKTVCFELVVKKRGDLEVSARLVRELSQIPGVTQVNWD